MTWKLLCDECDDVHGAEPCYCDCTEKPPLTREDVAFLRAEAKSARERNGPLIAEAFDYDGLADRIEGLLRQEDR